MITKVTMTGADDSISPAALIPLTEKYPFVEWGILVSRRNFGSNRFPSQNWLRLLEVMKKDRPEIKLSCHLCGIYVKHFLLGIRDAILGLDTIWNIFDRVQLNTHGIEHDFNAKYISDLMSQYSEKEFIIQYDGVNTELLFSVGHLPNCSALFDLSHGAGILPNEWPSLLPNVPCGYAGGISPENIEGQIIAIERRAGNNQIWIDMETHVRSNMDTQFDLEKVERCLEIASKYVKTV